MQSSNAQIDKFCFHVETVQIICKVGSGVQNTFKQNSYVMYTFMFIKLVNVYLLYYVLSTDPKMLIPVLKRVSSTYNFVSKCEKMNNVT